MTNIVILAVAAAWAAVLVPPLLRNRTENRPGTSVSDFNRQLSSLQRSVPTRGLAPMRSMARPLAQSPLARPAAPGRPGQIRRSQPHTSTHNREHMSAASLQRRTHGEPTLVRTHDHNHRQAHLNRVPSNRHELRRRRSNVLFLLVLSASATLFLAATTHANVMMYAFALSFLALCGYCYKLVQIKQNELHSQYADGSWFRAA
ncbi:unannotated protein [freshwater metagenome]|uniref:Unannotated protein n=1 Tax=freshwater metagenome TaxID=449393 RepID=A0A6J7DDS1_9ZZZZ|nr:hypothetical protein [Actinomycetota bacterium]